MKVAVTGSSGLIGSALVESLKAAGHEVTRVPRGQFEVAESREALVHLAGENIAGRWTVEKKQRIRDSRLDSTRRLCEAVLKTSARPKVFVCASAIGYYGDRGEEVLTEESSMGTGFLADVCRDWEAATKPAAQKGVRVVNLRFTVVLSAKGGALAKMLLPFNLGLGGIVGRGRQWWSWVAIDDAVGAIIHALTTEQLSGPVNVASPSPVTNREFTKTLGRVLGRPTIFPMPAVAARLAFGEMADAALLASARVQPAKLTASGYRFRYPDLEHALRHVLGS